LTVEFATTTVASFTYNGELAYQGWLFAQQETAA
jgi:hypothetical protein